MAEKSIGYWFARALTRALLCKKAPFRGSNNYYFHVNNQDKQVSSVSLSFFSICAVTAN